MSGTVFYKNLPGPAFPAYGGDEAEAFDHLVNPLPFAEGLTANDAVSDSYEFRRLFVAIDPCHPIRRAGDWPVADHGVLPGITSGRAP